jgi:hypothetical protein
MTTFNPNNITPPEELFLQWQRDHSTSCTTLAARWGAGQAVEALKNYTRKEIWPTGLTRPVTKADADTDGAVQHVEKGRWTYCYWRDIEGTSIPWLHTPNWQPKPEPTLQVQALNILEDSIYSTRGDGWAEISPDNVRKLREALLSIPSDIVGEVHLRTGGENTFHTTWKK